MTAGNDSFLRPSYAEAAKGLWPHEFRLDPGAVLYRFIDTTRSAPPAAADSPWWFEFEHFQTIKHFALRHGHSLGYAARLFASIFYEWSEVNAVVRAQVYVPLVAWKGKGKQVIVGGYRPPNRPQIDPRDINRTRAGLVTERQPTSLSKMTPIQGPNEVYQIYVPGLGHPHRRFSQYFKFLDVQSIATG